jgi:DNA-binding MarR family transcriptional regulator
MNNTFFKPTPLYKEFMILDLIEKNKDITQREMADEIGVAVSMINGYLDEYEKKKLIRRKKHSSKTVEYHITKKGVERKKVLNIGYLNSTHQLYESALSGLEDYLKEIEEKGYKNVVLYGAGEVAEMMTFTYKNSDHLSFEINAIIDDDVIKVGSTLNGIQIISLSEINNYNYDMILISSYTQQEVIYNKLLNSRFINEIIYKFFDFN